jgi:hypothetical protein
MYTVCLNPIKDMKAFKVPGTFLCGLDYCLNPIKDMKLSGVGLSFFADLCGTHQRQKGFKMYYAKSKSQGLCQNKEGLASKKNMVNSKGADTRALKNIPCRSK